MATEDYRYEDGKTIVQCLKEEKTNRCELRWSTIKATKGITEISRNGSGLIVFEYKGKVYYLGLMKMVCRLRGTNEWKDVSTLT